MADIRYPKITAATTEGQLRQMQDYLHQLTNQLNFALKTTEEREREYVVSLEKTGSSAGKSAVAAGTSGKSAEELFVDLKTLIIKSADIVNAYYDVIEERLSGEYVAQSDFGTYRETVDSLETRTAEYEATFRDSIQTIEDELGNLSEIRSSFYVKTGWLDDGIGGIELGQSKTSEDGTDMGFARFTTDALTFYDGGGFEEQNELAKFSPDGNTFSFTKFLGDVELGRYQLVTGNGIAFKWLG